MTMATEGDVTYELRDGVASLGLNRPYKRNAIDEALLGALGAAVRLAQDEARALVVFGHGPCFSAGLDLTEQRAREPAAVFHQSLWTRTKRRGSTSAQAGYDRNAFCQY